MIDGPVDGSASVGIIRKKGSNSVAAITEKPLNLLFIVWTFVSELRSTTLANISYSCHEGE